MDSHSLLVEGGGAGKWQTRVEANADIKSQAREVKV